MRDYYDSPAKLAVAALAQKRLAAETQRLEAKKELINEVLTAIIDDKHAGLDSLLNRLNMVTTETVKKNADDFHNSTLRKCYHNFIGEVIVLEGLNYDKYKRNLVQNYGFLFSDSNILDLIRHADAYLVEDFFIRCGWKRRHWPCDIAVALAEKGFLYELRTFVWSDDRELKKVLGEI